MRMSHIIRWACLFSPRSRSGKVGMRLDNRWYTIPPWARIERFIPRVS